MPNNPNESVAGSHGASDVDLVDFIIYASKDRVLLEWTTDNEIGNIGFAIERRLMDEDEWSQVAFVAGAGSYFERKEYSHEDIPGCKGLLSYRLRQTSADGSYNYSHEAGVTIKKFNTSFTLYQNFPNPFISSTNISFQLPDELEGDVTLKVCNSSQSEIRELFNRTAAPGYYNVEWNGNNDENKSVSPGVYEFVLQSEQGILRKKMMKLSYNPEQQ